MESFPRIEPKGKSRKILERINSVAVHASDLDGLASAALIFLMKPSVKIDYLTVSEALNSYGGYDLVIDLPKIGDAINIDHHKTNYDRLALEGRLSDMDLVDPNTPSAAILVARYFGIEDDPHVMKIVDMATKSDLGKYDDKIYAIDKVIKCNSRNKAKLHKIMLAIAMYADEPERDEWLRSEIERIRPVFEICKKVSRSVTNVVLNELGIKYMVVHIASGIPRICVGDIMHDFMGSGGKVVVLINTMRDKDEYCPSLTENMGRSRARISIRSAEKSFDAREVLEFYGGGGHRQAAGAKVSLDLLPEFMLFIFRKLSEFGSVVYLRVDEKFVKELG